MLIFNGQITPESEVPRKLDEERLRKISEKDKEKRMNKKRNRGVASESPPINIVSAFDFGSPDRNIVSAFDIGSPVRMDESPPRRNVVSALNFRTPGGKKRSLKRKTRTRKTRTRKTRKTRTRTRKN